MTTIQAFGDDIEFALKKGYLSVRRRWRSPGRRVGQEASRSRSD